MLESHLRDTSPVRKYSESENTSMELESFSIDVDNTPTRVNYPPLEEYSHCIIRRSNFKIINEGMIPRVLPEPRALDPNSENNLLLQNTTTPNFNLICSSPFPSRLDPGNSKRSSPIVCALPDDFAKSNEVFKHVYGSSSFTESPITHQSSSIRSKLNQECSYRITPANQGDQEANASESHNGWKRSNASSVMSIELLINPESPEKGKRDAASSKPGFYGVSTSGSSWESNCYEPQTRAVFDCKYKGEDVNPYDQFIVTIKLPSKYVNSRHVPKKDLRSLAAERLPVVGTTKKGIIKKKKYGSNKNDGSIIKHVTKTKKRNSKITKKEFPKKQIPKSQPPTIKTKSIRSRKTRSNGYESDEEYLPHEESTISSRKRVQFGSDRKEKKRKSVVRSKTGCWTCRIRHKGCNEEQPKCSHCKRLNLTCDYSPNRPVYMQNKKLHAEKLLEIRRLTDRVKKRKPHS